MGKKKGKHRGRNHEAGSAGGLGAVAGIAAMALEQAKAQFDGPAGRQALAAGLRAAADALAPRPTGAASPGPAAAAETSPDATNPSEPPRAPDVPPEVARVIGSVAAGLESWANRWKTPKD